MPGAKAPAENAVMVFKVTSRLKLGHVAVVTKIVSSREIRVDQANWQNHGEIDHSTPVMDVSKKNDWSQVRVWDIKSSQFGRVYPVAGFISQDWSARRTTTKQTSGPVLALVGLADQRRLGEARLGRATGAAFLSALGFFFSRLFFCSRLAMAALRVWIWRVAKSDNKKPGQLRERAKTVLRSPRNKGSLRAASFARRGTGRRDDGTNKKPRRISGGASVCDGGLLDFFFLPLADLAAFYSPAA